MEQWELQEPIQLPTAFRKFRLQKKCQSRGAYRLSELAKSMPSQFREHVLVTQEHSGPGCCRFTWIRSKTS